MVPDKPLKPIDVNDNLGLRFDRYGNCMPHSILGNVEDFIQESTINGKIVVNIIPEAYKKKYQI